MRLTGERARTVVRPELVKKYGYDTKFVMHALRLGLQGIELLSDGRLTLPVREPDLTLLQEVRIGVVHYEEAVRLIQESEAKLLAIVDRFTKLVDEGAINAFMVRAHRGHWCGRKQFDRASCNERSAPFLEGANCGFEPVNGSRGPPRRGGSARDSQALTAGGALIMGNRSLFQTGALRGRAYCTMRAARWTGLAPGIH
jgi:hypothetical protein